MFFFFYRLMEKKTKKKKRKKKRKRCNSCLVAYNITVMKPHFHKRIPFHLACGIY